MKKLGFLLGLAVVLALSTSVWAEEGADGGEISRTVTPADASTTDPSVPSDSAAPAEVAAAEPAAVDNLEFVSGEVSAADETAKSITVKLYGEGDAQATEKVLTVTVDDSTDITDGEKDRDLKSLTAGTEVDVEYDPATTKATYIFVY